MLKKIPLFFLLMISFRGQAQEPLLRNLQTSFTYSGDVYANLSGGLETGVRYMDNIDVKAGFDIKGANFFFYGLGNQGKSISEIVGDIQTVSNIDALNSWRLYEAWINKPMQSIKSSVLFGLYNLNSEFDVINTGSLFINSSHGIGRAFSSSGITGPSIFPLTSLAARLKINPVKGIVFKFAVLDAVPSDPTNTKGTSVYLRESEGALLVSEISVSKPGENTEALLGRGINRDTPFRLVLGGWKYTEERTGWLDESESDHGVYAFGEITLQNGFSFFGRAGAANRDINRFNYYLGAGLNYSGLFKNRFDDMLGLAVALPINSDDFVLVEERRGNDFSRNELNIELTYLMSISEHVSFQFDTQYIQHPNQAPDIEDAFLVGIRSVFGF
ncbi:MAG: carbohydrate porin [Balneolaceae bacterium]|nr:carbohydrate porin [Balneolaceae bacterium]MBO6545875.1 carbohydrate porin [Balneolaceae bacterium]MBO6647271.1 carbohydrate porin [Balneolaceae bacterium]